MLTRCPHCATTFRVTPEQLKARQGRVRCGECQQVFNALDTLVEMAPAEISGPVRDIASPLPEAASPAKTVDDERGCPAEEETPTDETADSAAEADVAPAMEEATVADGPAVPIEMAASSDPSAADKSAEPAETPEFSEPLEPAASAEALQPAEPPQATPEATDAAVEDWPTPVVTKRPRIWPWALGGIAALCVLVLQAALHFRTEIAVLQPGMKPLLAAACEAFACKLRLPRKSELMSIETSDLHPDADGKLALAATLKNRAPFAQEYPHLELTLTDTADKALVRRVLPPAEYLAAASRSETGLAAGKDIAVDLSIEVPGVPAAGYRLYLFYP